MQARRLLHPKAPDSSGCRRDACYTLGRLIRPDAGETPAVPGNLLFEFESRERHLDVCAIVSLLEPFQRH